jgi:two-component system, NarL family, invasion response regulator UvrY
MIRVLVCDDHAIVRQGIRQMLADAPDMQVAAEAADGAEGIALVRQAAADGMPLDVVLLDIAMPRRDGLDVLKQIKDEFARLPVLVLSTYPDRQYAVRCLRLGAAGYLNKSADSEQVLAAIRRVATGARFITPAVAEHLAGAIGVPSSQAPHEAFSNREYQVFGLLARGLSVGEIAQQLSLSSNTVSTYRTRILEKTGLRNDVELALYAVQQQLLD